MRYFRPRFNKGQRSELVRLGLLPEQIDSVEDVLQPALAMLLNEDKKPAVQDVGAEFDRLLNALQAAHAALSNLALADDDKPAYAARAETRLRIELASYSLTRTYGSDGPMSKALESIALCETLIAKARADAPTAPARRMLASPFPIKLIHESLLHGWGKAQWPNLRVGANEPPKTLPPFNVHVSASPTAPFRLVVQACYSAMKRPNTDPEKAIKAYKRWLKKERNVPPVSDVPS
jgi:hypothetical protein